MNNSSAFKQLSDWMKTDLRSEHFEMELKALIKREKLQLLKEVEECVPKKKDIRVQETYNGRDFKKGEQDKEIGFNDCRTQIIKSIKELGEEL